MPTTAIADKLTNREIEVVGLVAQGLPNRRVAERLHLSTDTVKSHLKAAFTKLDVHNRTELALLVVSDDSFPRQNVA